MVRPPGVQDFEIKNILQDVEAFGVPRNQVKFSAICDANPALYGESKSDQRVKFTKFWSGNLKSIPIKKYKQRLDEFRVQPSASTLKEIELQENEAVDEDEDDMIILSDSLNNLSFGQDNRVNFANMNSPPTLRTPNRNHSKMGLIKPSPGVPGWASPAQSVAGTAAISASTGWDSLSMTDTFDPETMSLTSDGTKEKPFVIFVDNEYPERHREFDIQYVEDVEHNQYMRNAYHIRKEVAIQDREKWCATIPHGRYPHLAGRIVQIRGPSRSFWFSSPKYYHDAAKSQVCEA